MPSHEILTQIFNINWLKNLSSKTAIIFVFEQIIIDKEKSQKIQLHH